MKNFSSVLLYSAITAALVSARVVPENRDVNANEIESRSIVEYTSEIPTRSLRPYAREDGDDGEFSEYDSSTKATDEDDDKDKNKANPTKPSPALASKPPKKSGGDTNVTEIGPPGHHRNSTHKKLHHKPNGKGHGDSLSGGEGKNKTGGHKKTKPDGSGDLTKDEGGSTNNKAESADSYDDEDNQDKDFSDVVRDLTGLDLVSLRTRALQFFGSQKRDSGVAGMPQEAPSSHKGPSRKRDPDDWTIAPSSHKGPGKGHGPN